MRVLKYGKALVVLCGKDGSIYVEDGRMSAYVRSLEKKKVEEALRGFRKSVVEVVLKMLEEAEHQN